MLWTTAELDVDDIYLCHGGYFFIYFFAGDSLTFLTKIVRDGFGALWIGSLSGLRNFLKGSSPLQDRTKLNILLVLHK